MCSRGVRSFRLRVRGGVPAPGRGDTVGTLLRNGELLGLFWTRTLVQKNDLENLSEKNLPSNCSAHARVTQAVSHANQPLLLKKISRSDQT